MPIVRRLMRQAPRELPPVRSGRKLPRASNDNTPPSANDNIADALGFAADVAPMLPWPRFAARFMPYVGAAITAYELYKLWNEHRGADAYEYAPGSWIYRGRYNNSFQGSKYPVADRQSILIAVPNGTNSSTTNTQFPTSSTRFEGFQLPGGKTQRYIRWDELVIGAGAANTNLENRLQLWENTNQPAASTPRRYGIPIRPMPNPNVLRQAPGTPVAPDPGVRPSRPPVPEEWQFVDQGPAATPHGRRPPRRYQREGKVISRSARVGMALYRALDTASERAELIDAIYDALPDDVKDRWSRGRENRIGDQFGQYGLEGADWKLQALWHNWHRLDVAQAVENIVKNAIEDEVIGAISRRLPRNTVNAFDGYLYNDRTGRYEEASPEQIIAERLKDLFEEA